MVNSGDGDNTFVEERRAVGTAQGGRANSYVQIPLQRHPPRRSGGRVTGGRVSLWVNSRGAETGMVVSGDNPNTERMTNKLQIKLEKIKQPIVREGTPRQGPGTGEGLSTVFDNRSRLRKQKGRDLRPRPVR